MSYLRAQLKIIDKILIYRYSKNDAKHVILIATVINGYLSKHYIVDHPGETMMKCNSQKYIEKSFTSKLYVGHNITIQKQHINFECQGINAIQTV